MLVHTPSSNKNLGKIFSKTLLIIVITGCIAALALLIYIRVIIRDINNLDLAAISLNYTSIIYAKNMETGEYFELQRIHGAENRIWVDLDQISPHLINVAIALEDRRFNEHRGFDWRRTTGAFFGMLGFAPAGTTPGGGSTIAQQLVRNITGDNDVTLARKIREIFSALELARNFSRDEIMEAYLNTIAFGNNTHGVEAAANLYFNKSANELTIAEAAAIISITQSPSRLEPFANPTENQRRRTHAINLLLEQGFINEEQHLEAINEELVFTRSEGMLNTSNSWFVDYVIDSVIRDLMLQEDISFAQAEARIMRGGYRIFTTVDIEMQQYLEMAFLVDNPAFPSFSNNEYPQGAFVILDHHGKILALAGGNREKTGDRIFNRATDARRQPGSTIKPLTAYLHAFQMGLIHWSSMVDDSPMQYGGLQQFPLNHYHYYMGNITIETAIVRSTNTIPVKIIQDISPLRAFNFLRDNFGFSALAEPYDVSLAPMALGGMRMGVSPLEIVGAYQIFANGGWFTQPYAYTRVENAAGDVVLQVNTTPARVIDFETASIINMLLQRTVTSPVGTGNCAFMGHMPVAGKTGTSQNDRDHWFIGLTPYFISGVWLGFDNPQTITWEESHYPPALLWRNIIEPLHRERGLEPKPFAESPNLVSMLYCTVSGGIAGSACTSTLTGWYNSSLMPAYCMIHR